MRLRSLFIFFIVIIPICAIMAQVDNGQIRFLEESTSKKKDTIQTNIEGGALLDEDEFFFDDATLENIVLPTNIFVINKDTVYENILTGIVSFHDGPGTEIDAEWLKMHDYYAIWDSKGVNPYRVDGLKIKDSFHVSLSDSSVQYCHFPLLNKAFISSDFGVRRYRWHYGIDLRLDIGDSVKTIFDGIVRISKYNKGGYGYYVLVRHENGLETLYGHLSKPIVAVGDSVMAGNVVGLGGNTGKSTGPHLHFEVRYKGNPIDPKRIFDF